MEANECSCEGSVLPGSSVNPNSKDSLLISLWILKLSAMGAVTFTWAIKEFDMCPHVSGKSLHSADFSIDGSTNATFKLILYPRGNKEKYKNYVALFLQRQNDKGENKMYIEYELFLVHATGNGKRFLKSRRLFHKNMSLGCLNFYKRNVLLNSVGYRFLPENTLTIKCRLSVLDQNDNIYQKMYSTEDHESLFSDFGELLKSGIHSDMTIVVGEKEFRVHRNIIECRCPKLLEQLVKLEDSNVYFLPSIEAPVLQHILGYLYTGVYCDDGFLEKVFIAANTFSLTDFTLSLFPYPACIKSTTRMNAFQATITWVVEDFGRLSLTKGNSLLLLSENMPRWTWMKIWLSKPQNDEDNSYVLSLQRMFEDEATFLHCEIKILETGDKLKVFEHAFDNEETHWETPIPFEANSVEEMAQNGDLRLQLKIRVSASGHDTTETEEVEYNTITLKKSIFVDSCAFQKDLQKFYENMMHADLILCVDGEKLPAHRTILCARSEFFSKMFSHDRKENLTDVVSLKDIDVSTIASMLMYMYCGVLDGALTVPKAIELYIASNRYMLWELKEKCSRYLKFNVNAETVGDVLALADLHQDYSLKKRLFLFISLNSERILDSERGLNAFESIGSVTLYAEIVNLLLGDTVNFPSGCDVTSRTQNLFRKQLARLISLWSMVSSSD